MKKNIYEYNNSNINTIRAYEVEVDDVQRDKIGFLPKIVYHNEYDQNHSSRNTLLDQDS